MGHLPIQVQCQYWLCHVSKVVTCKIKCCRIVLELQSSHNTSSLVAHNHMPPLYMPASGTKIKHVIARWIALLIVEDGGCSLTFMKVTKGEFPSRPLSDHILV